MVTGWMAHSGPVTAAELGDLLGIATCRNREGAAAARSERRDSARQLHRVRRRQETEWCDRRLLARIHRLTVGTLRKQVEPVNAAQFMRWLLRWQHVAPGSQCWASAARSRCCSRCRDLRRRRTPGSGRFWRGASRITTRRCSISLSLTGAVGWGRLSPHPATLETVGPKSGGWCPRALRRSRFSCARMPTG